MSVREEKAPQLICDRITQLEVEAGLMGGTLTDTVGRKLYLRVPTIDDPRVRKAQLVINMFPGEQQIVVYCTDTGKRFGMPGELRPALLKEMEEMFGKENVVVR